MVSNFFFKPKLSHRSLCSQNILIVADLPLTGRREKIKRKLAQAACVRHTCLRAPCIAWPLLLPLFSLSFFLSLSLSVSLSPLFLRLLLFTNFGETPVCKIISPQIFWHKINAKKNRANFLLFTASVRSRPPGPPAVPGVLHLENIFRHTKISFLFHCFISRN